MSFRNRESGVEGTSLLVPCSVGLWVLPACPGDALGLSTYIHPTLSLTVTRDTLAFSCILTASLDVFITGVFTYTCVRMYTRIGTCIHASCSIIEHTFFPAPPPRKPLSHPTPQQVIVVLVHLPRQKPQAHPLLIT